MELVVILTVSTIVVCIAAAAIYSYVSGDDSSLSVDPDNDGEDEFDVSFSGGNEELLDQTVDFSDELDDLNTVPAAVVDAELTDITGVGETRAEALAEAGFESATDVYMADDEELLDVHGIGPRALSQIRNDIGSADDD